MILAGLVYISDVWILLTYGLLAGQHSAKRTRWFHWANAVGAIPTVMFEAIAHAWPVMPLTITFGVLGWVGVWRTRND